MKTRTLSILCATVLCVVVALVVLLIKADWREPGPLLPDEKTAGMELLANKLSGPGYFKPVGGPEVKPGFISQMDAKNQVNTVLQERKWSADLAPELETLIDQLTEPTSPSRTLGVYQVSLVRLNLALDALH